MGLKRYSFVSSQFCRSEIWVSLAGFPTHGLTRWWPKWTLSGGSGEAQSGVGRVQFLAVGCLRSTFFLPALRWVIHFYGKPPSILLICLPPCLLQCVKGMLNHCGASNLWLLVASLLPLATGQRNSSAFKAHVVRLAQTIISLKFNCAISHERITEMMS